MAQADSHNTRLSTLFRDPFVRAAFKAAEDDGTGPEMVEVYTGRDETGALVKAIRPRVLDGGAAERVLEMEGA